MTQRNKTGTLRHVDRDRRETRVYALAALGHSAGTQRMHRASASRAMGLLAMIGTAGVCLPTVLHPSFKDAPALRAGMISLMVIACAVGIVLLAIGDRTPLFLCYLLPVVAVAIWTAGAMATSPTTTSKIFLCWAVLFGAYFYRAHGAWLMTAYSIVACAVVSFSAFPTQVALTHLAAVGSGLCGITAVVSSIRASQFALIDRLRAEAPVDSLTGLSTRRVLATSFEAFAAQRHPNEPISLVVADVDGLKRINDAYGHPVGDRVLIELATLAKMRSTSADVVTRLGGDETAILLPGRTYAEALAYASQLERAIGRVKVAPGSRLRMSISVGVATAPYDGKDLDGLYAVADRRLYESKGLRRSYGAAATDPHDDERQRRDHNQDDHDLLEDPGVLLDLVPPLAEAIAGNDEDRVPDQAASGRQRQERDDTHPFETGRDGYQTSEDGNHPSEEDGLTPVPVEPRFGAVDVVELDERKPVDDRPESIAADQRADVVEDRCADDRT